MSGDFSALLDFPFAHGAGGGGSTGLVPEPYDVAIGGRAYMVDWKSGVYAHESIPYLRPFSTSEGDLGEKILNPEALWRVSQRSWHKGAGQRHLDRPDSDAARFWTSKGVDPWDREQLRLLPDTILDADLASGGSPLLAVAGSWLFVAASNAMKKTNNLTTVTAITGTPAAITSIASDGANVRIAGGASGIYTVASGGTAATLWQAGTYDLVGYVKSRVMAASGPNLYNVIIPDAVVPQTAIFTHPNPSFVWTGFAEGNAFIYAAGTAGDKSAIYRLAVKDDGSIGAAVVSGRLPSGETVNAIYGYLGFMLIGTSLGVRFAVQEASGDLTIGAVIETTGTVRCFDGHGPHVWFGWENYDASSTGLGRIDLRIVNEGFAPAYASDLMRDGQGAVTSVVTFLERRVFGVAGQGTIAQHPTNLVPSGTVDSGLVSYDIPDDKIALYVQVIRERPYDGTIALGLSVNQGEFVDMGSRGPGSQGAAFDARQSRGESLETRLTLTPDGTVGPSVLRVTVLSQPDARSGMFITVPLILSDRENVDGELRDRDPFADYLYLTGLRQSKQLVPYQEQTVAWTVVMDDYRLVPTGMTDDPWWLAGTFIAKLKTIDTA